VILEVRSAIADTQAEPLSEPSMNSDPMPTPPVPLTSRFYRHRLPVCVLHWINVVSLTILLMSGLNIFNAHPSLC
jgi:hypothetical protein